MIKLPGWARMAVLIVVSMILTYPFLSRGLTDGDDRAAHLEYQHFFNEAIARGELYPRWIPGLNRGLGSPIFFVQYPLPYYVAWGIGHVIPNHWNVYTETRTQGLGMVLATILGALFAYAWCTTFADGVSAMIASLVFVTLPYFLAGDLYHRDAIGELWALSIMPLAFYFVERAPTRPRRSVAGLAVAFALILFSHLFTAFLLAPLLVAYAVWRSGPRKGVALLRTAGGLALGAALAAVYLLTVFAQSRYLNPGGLLALRGANYSPLSQMFPYNSSMFPDEGPAWRHLDWLTRCLGAAAIGLAGFACYLSRRAKAMRFRVALAVLSIAMLALTIVASHLTLGAVAGALPLNAYQSRQRAHVFVYSFLTLEAAMLCYWSLRRRTHAAIADFLMCMALLSYWMMTRWSLPVWNAVHPLWSLQFPWRLNVFLAVAVAGLVALAASDLAKRPLPWRVTGGAIAIAVWVLIAGGAARAGGVTGEFRSTKSVAYEPSVDAGLPVYVRVGKLQDALDAVSASTGELSIRVMGGNGTAKITTLGPRAMQLAAACDSGCTLQLSQFYYPAWRARLANGGIEIPLRASLPAGLMEISLPPGENSVMLELPRGLSEQVGPWVSLASLLLVILLAANKSAVAGCYQAGKPIHRSIDR